MYHQCCSVIRRLITLIYQRAHLEAEVTAIRRQAEQANRELQRRLQDDDQEVHVSVMYIHVHVCMFIRICSYVYVLSVAQNDMYNEPHTRSERILLKLGPLYCCTLLA